MSKLEKQIIREIYYRLNRIWSRIYNENPTRISLQLNRYSNRSEDARVVFYVLRRAEEIEQVISDSNVLALPFADGLQLRVESDLEWEAIEVLMNEARIKLGIKLMPIVAVKNIRRAQEFQQSHFILYETSWRERNFLRTLKASTTEC